MNNVTSQSSTKKITKTELHIYSMLYRLDMNKQVEFEDRATERSFRLHVKKEFVRDNKEIHLSISPHYGHGSLFGLEEQTTELGKTIGGTSIHPTYGQYVLFSDNYDELVKFIKEKYNIDPIFPESFPTKIEIIRPQIETARRDNKRRFRF